MGKRLQLRLLSDVLTGEWRNGEAGEAQGSEPREPGGLRQRQEVCHEGPPTRTRWGGYHLARRGGPPESNGVQYLQKQTSNLFHEASITTFLDLALEFFNFFLWSGVGTTPHSRSLQFRFQFQVHLDQFFYRKGVAAGRRTPPHRLEAVYSVGCQG